jgi:hypothetical protein
VYLGGLEVACREVGPGFERVDEVVRGLDPGQRGRERGAVENVPPDDFGLPAARGREPLGPSHEAPDAIARALQLAKQSAADVSGGACEEDEAPGFGSRVQAPSP